MLLEISVVIAIIFILIWVNRKETMYGVNTVRFHYTNWCGFCTRMKPVWNEVKLNLGNKYHFIEIDEDIAKTPGITSYPTIMFTDSRSAVHVYPGKNDVNELASWILSFYIIKIVGS